MGERIFKVGESVTAFFAAHLRQLIERERVDGNTQEKVAWLEEQLEQEIQFQLEEQLDDSDEEMIADL